MRKYSGVCTVGEIWFLYPTRQGPMALQDIFEKAQVRILNEIKCNDELVMRCEYTSRNTEQQKL